MSRRQLSDEERLFLERRRRELTTDGLPMFVQPNAQTDPIPIQTPAPSVPRRTSEDAADRQSVPKRETDRVRILQALALSYDGYTRDELAEKLSVTPNTVRPRIAELRTLGFVHDGRLTRLTVTGSPAAVVEITQEGLAYLSRK